MRATARPHCFSAKHISRSHTEPGVRDMKEYPLFYIDAQYYSLLRYWISMSTLRSLCRRGQLLLILLLLGLLRLLHLL